MVKSLHRSLEAELASIKDPDYDESDGDEENEENQTKTISAIRTGKGDKRKGRKKDATIARPAAEEDDASDRPSTVIYLGHLPVDFEEREITTFLNQFGAVRRCRVSRSTKTGRSRGYAFVDFADAEVARIVAETMSGYFLMEKRLVCHLIPNDRVRHELMFARPKRVPTKADRQKEARAETNKRRTADAMRVITARLVKRERMKRQKLASLGIDYDFPGYGASAQLEAESNALKKKRMASYGNDNRGDENETNNIKYTTKIDTTERKEEAKSKTGSMDDIMDQKKEDAKIDKVLNEAPITEEEPLKKKKKKSKKSKKKAKTTKK